MYYVRSTAIKYLYVCVCVCVCVCICVVFYFELSVLVNNVCVCRLLFNSERGNYEEMFRVENKLLQTTEFP